MERRIIIPIIEVTGNQQRVAGNFCSTSDAVSAAELEALAQLRRLHQQAQQIKRDLSQTDNIETRQLLQFQLQQLRQEADLWQQKRRQASHDKLVALGHTA
ncbi:MAG: hypothetical protein HQL60_02765 [Magnetococcales bacterium]|nr:hypothetical protein [Magnetococcales bacterium]